MSSTTTRIMRSPASTIMFRLHPSTVQKRSFFSTPLRLATTPAPLSPSSSLNWPQYLKLRSRKRTYGLLFSIPTTLLSTSLGIQYFATIEAEPTDLIMGVEPIYAYGAATVACAVVGWLVGPVVGAGVWRMVNRTSMRDMEIMDKEFFKHVVKNRVDPSRQSVSNPVPDYYCEKVGSLKGYRQWLRDQSAYRRKAQFGEGSERVL